MSRGAALIDGASRGDGGSAPPKGPAPASPIGPVGLSGDHGGVHLPRSPGRHRSHQRSPAREGGLGPMPDLALYGLRPGPTMPQGRYRPVRGQRMIIATMGADMPQTQLRQQPGQYRLPDEAGEPAGSVRVACAEFRGRPSDLPVVRDALIEAIAKVAEVIEVAGDVQDTKLRLAGGAVVRLVAAVPAQPAAHPWGTFTVTAMLHGTATLPARQVAALLGAMRRVPFTPTEMTALRDQMPLTAELPLFLPPDCLSAVAPVLTVHHMTDFLVLVEAVRAMGVPPEAITVIDKQYPYQHADRVDAHLVRQGIAVWPWQHTAHALDSHVRRAAALGRRGLLIDDGGYTLPVLLTHRPHLLPFFDGLVEQTISGITRLERWPRLPLPVFSVAESRLKATIESYGVADAAIRNLLHVLPQEKLEGQPALVIEFGRIGEQIAAVLNARRMRVAVYDRQIVRLIAAQERGLLTARCLSTLWRSRRPVLVVGSTGRTSVRGEHAAAITRDCFLVSTTSRDREFAIAELAEEATAITGEGVVGTRLWLRPGADVTLVGDGLPINFHFAESLPNSSSDLILAALLVGAATLAPRPRVQARPQRRPDRSGPGRVRAVGALLHPVRPTMVITERVERVFTSHDVKDPRPRGGDPQHAAPARLVSRGRSGGRGTGRARGGAPLVAGRGHRRPGRRLTGTGGPGVGVRRALVRDPPPPRDGRRVRDQPGHSAAAARRCGPGAAFAHRRASRARPLGRGGGVGADDGERFGAWLGRSPEVLSGLEEQVPALLALRCAARDGALPGTPEADRLRELLKTRYLSILLVLTHRPLFDTLTRQQLKEAPS
ncbi:hypothetical protein [Spongiactinospora sp. 9N601]|uniref:hypothetical protein n=1 Tax=Spongiactinospora sp. 9N601 TaxID=3375149 RepID=UPI00379D073D